MARTTLEDFVEDLSTTGTVQRARVAPEQSVIAGVVLTSLSRGADDRGELNELLTTRDGPIEPIVHVYQVQSAPQSVRAWFYHKRQSDRLALTQGAFRIVLYDLRPDSVSYGKLEVHHLGQARRMLLTIPPLVIHGVKNVGENSASFVNMPTSAYDPERPDKWRLPVDHPGIPYRFD